MYLLANVAAIVLAAGSASASTEAESNPPKQEAKPEKPKKICRSVVVTGSIMPSSICKTKEEWAEITRARIDETDRTKTSGQMPSGRGSLGQ